MKSISPSRASARKLAQKLHVAGDQMMVPGAGHKVGAHVGVQPEVLDPVTLVVVEPASVRELTASKATRRRRRPRQPGPPARSAPWPPRRGSRGRSAPQSNHGILPIMALHRRDGVAGGKHLRTGEDAGHRRQRGPPERISSVVMPQLLAPVWSARAVRACRRGVSRSESGRSATLASGFVRYRTKLLPMTGLNTRSAVRVTEGALDDVPDQHLVGTPRPPGASRWTD